jgi:hypothetical protein
MSRTEQLGRSCAGVAQPQRSRVASKCFHSACTRPGGWSFRNAFRLRLRFCASTMASSHSASSARSQSFILRCISFSIRTLPVGFVPRILRNRRPLRDCGFRVQREEQCTGAPPWSGIASLRRPPEASTAMSSRKRSGSSAGAGSWPCAAGRSVRSARAARSRYRVQFTRALIRVPTYSRTRFARRRLTSQRQ